MTIYHDEFDAPLGPAWDTPPATEQPLSRGMMTCTRCGAEAGEVPDLSGMPAQAVIALCSEWKCSDCLDEDDDRPGVFHPGLLPGAEIAALPAQASARAGQGGEDDAWLK